MHRFGGNERLLYKLKSTQEFDTISEKFIQPGLLQVLAEKIDLRFIMSALRKLMQRLKSV
jgi:hypothetical protein